MTLLIGPEPVAGRAPAASAALRLKLELAAPTLRQAMAAVWQPPGLAERYLDYLEVMHTVIRASVPLMRTAARRCAELGPSDPLADQLGDYLTEHIAEELDHDDWLLADLALAGRDPAAVLADQPTVPVARLVGAQYYWIAHHHPISLIGYIAVLEGNSPPCWLADRLATRTGLPIDAFRTLHHHAAADLDHTADLDALLDRLPLTAAHQQAVAVSALATVAALAEVFDRLTNRPYPIRY
ncbi:MAG: iron-containing redox enzyme family protein [Jatrophihabitantaceae bacterium]